jgi:NAD+ diphosphatase
MIHEILPHIFNNHYIPDKNIENNDFILHYYENSILMKAVGDEFVIPQKNDLSQICDKTNSTFLFTLDEASYFLKLDDLKEAGSYLIYKDINFFRSSRQQEIAWISIVGFHLRNWYSENRYCGKCGSKTRHKNDERALQCINCNSVFFPKISPAIIVAIICKDKILLASNPKFPGAFYSLIAGYVDVGETLEEALIREVKEEVGLDVTNIRYYKSQPWPLSGSMMIGFIAEADDNLPIIIDKKEISDAAWFTRGNLPYHALNISIAGEMIEKFEKGEL